MCQHAVPPQPAKCSCPSCCSWGRPAQPPRRRQAAARARRHARLRITTENGAKQKMSAEHIVGWVATTGTIARRRRASRRRAAARARAVTPGTGKRMTAARPTITMRAGAPSNRRAAPFLGRLAAVLSSPPPFWDDCLLMNYFWKLCCPPRPFGTIGCSFVYLPPAL